MKKKKSAVPGKCRRDKYSYNFTEIHVTNLVSQRPRLFQSITKKHGSVMI